MKDDDDSCWVSGYSLLTFFLIYTIPAGKGEPCLSYFGIIDRQNEIN